MVDDDVKREIKLKVAEANQDDVNKGIVRMDSQYMREIGIRPGNIVQIVGESATVAIADRALPGDMGLAIIRMDGLVRRNAKTTIGETVKILRADVVEAKKITIAPARKGIMVRANPQIFKRGLLGRAVVKGDIVSLGGTRQRRSTMTDNPFFDEMNIFSMLDEGMFNFGLGDLKFVVVEVAPAKKAVLITDSTQVIFNPEAVELKEETKAFDVTYEDIGGLDEELTKVREMVELPLKHPEIFERLGIEPPKGVLLHGPPGTGKTLLAKAVANETNSNFILINGPEIMSKYYGQSEENLRKKFEEAEKNAPSIIFIDEIDAIASKREESKGEVERRVVAQLLAIMDGLKSRGKVVVIAATNIPNQLDPALRRPGRFDREIEIGVPQTPGRLNILKIHSRNMPLRGRLHYDLLKNIFEKQYAAVTGKDTNLELSRLKEEKTRVEETLKEIATTKKDLEKDIATLENKLKNEGTIASIVSKIKGLHGDLKEMQEKYAELARESKNLSDKIADISSRVDKLRKTREKLKAEKSVTEKILNELISIVNRREIFSDERQKMVNNLADKDEKDYWEQLLQLGVISQEMIEEAQTDPEAINKDLKKLSEITHGFVGADLAALAKESAMIVLRREIKDVNLKSDQEIPKEVLDRLVISYDDFQEALKMVRPSALREVLIEIPNVHWTDIGGLDDVKQELVEAVDWPLKHKDAFLRLGVKPPKGVLLYGPPGTGKTLLAKAVAKESEANFILVKGPEMLSKWVGESEKAVRKIFEKARQTSPTIIFFDEIDSIAPRRGGFGGGSDSGVTERVVNQLLTEMDGVQELTDVVIVAATNRPDIIDPALLRPGRFDRIVLVPPPDAATRKKIFQVHLRGMSLATDVKAENLVEKTDGYVGADIEAVCREAAILALRKDIKATVIKMEFFEAALAKVRPSVTQEITQAYKEIEDQFRSAQAKAMKAEKPSYYG